MRTRAPAATIGMASKNLPAEALAEWRRVVPPLAGIVETVRANLATIAMSSTVTNQKGGPDAASLHDLHSR